MEALLRGFQRQAPRFEKIKMENLTRLQGAASSDLSPPVRRKAEVNSDLSPSVRRKAKANSDPSSPVRRKAGVRTVRDNAVQPKCQMSKDKCHRSEDKYYWSKDKYHRLEDKCQRLEDRCHRSGDNCHRSEDKYHRSEDKCHRLEDKCHRSEDKWYRSEDSVTTSTCQTSDADMDTDDSDLEFEKIGDEVMDQHGQALRVVDIAEQLQARFAYLTGGKGRNGAPIITLPEYPRFQEIQDQDFLSVMTYLTSIPSAEEAELGYVIVVDRRQDRWAAVKATLIRIAGFFPKHIQVVLVLRPTGFFQRTFSDIGFKFVREDFRLKVPMVMLNSVSELHEHLDRSQLTEELGGFIRYEHHDWIEQRSAIEKFASNTHDIAKTLQTLGTELAETELPNDIATTEALLEQQRKQKEEIKDDLAEAQRHGETLLSIIRRPSSDTVTADLCPSTATNVGTIERLIIQLEETDKAFDEFWSSHELKLSQCLQLRHFETEFRELKGTMDALQEQLCETQETGDSVARVDALLKEARQLDNKAKVGMDKVRRLVARGDELISENHYAVDSIRPKCREMQLVCEDFTLAMEKRIDLLNRSHDLQQRLEKANRWCTQGVDLLASQPIDKCQTQEGAESALKECQDFLKTYDDLRLHDPKEFHVKFEEMLTAESKASIQLVLQRIEDVQEMFEKRKVSLQKLAVKQQRPVQPVGPQPSPTHKPRGGQGARPGDDPAAKRISSASTSSDGEVTKRRPPRKSRHAPKVMKVKKMQSQRSVQWIQVMAEDSVEDRVSQTSTDSSEPEGTLENLATKRRHVMNELLDTEQIYVSELYDILEGYYKQFDNPELAHLIPPILHGKRSVLFGNLDEIYNFHNEVFLVLLESHRDRPALVGRCFVERQEDLQMYSKYCQNKTRSEALRRDCGDNAFFKECQLRLGHKLPLEAYLLKPVQRITKYQLLLKEMLKYTQDQEGRQDIDDALATMLEVLKNVNDIMHQIAITGFDGDLSQQGKLLMQGSFSVWGSSKDSKVKALRIRPMQRHIFLYEKLLLFCKKREDIKEGERACYSYKNCIQMSAVGITENVKGDARKFEVWLHGRAEVYTIQAPTAETKSIWLKEIRRVLLSQFDACKGGTGASPAATHKQQHQQQQQQQQYQHPQFDGHKGRVTSNPAGVMSDATFNPEGVTPGTTFNPAGVTPDMTFNPAVHVTPPESEGVTQRQSSDLSDMQRIQDTQRPNLSPNTVHKLMKQNQWGYQPEKSPSPKDHNDNGIPSSSSNGDSGVATTSVEDEDSDDIGWSSDEFSNSEDETDTRLYGTETPELLGQYVALADYNAVENGEISMSEGEIVDMLKMGEEGWCYVCISNTNIEGWAPASYLESVAPSHDALGVDIGSQGTSDVDMQLPEAPRLDRQIPEDPKLDMQTPEDHRLDTQSPKDHSLDTQTPKDHSLDMQTPEDNRMDRQTPEEPRRRAPSLVDVDSLLKMLEEGEQKRQQKEQHISEVFQLNRWQPKQQLLLDPPQTLQDPPQLLLDPPQLQLNPPPLLQGEEPTTTEMAALNETFFTVDSATHGSSPPTDRPPNTADEPSPAADRPPTPIPMDMREVESTVISTMRQDAQVLAGAFPPVHDNHGYHDNGYHGTHLRSLAPELLEACEEISSLNAEGPNLEGIQEQSVSQLSPIARPPSPHPIPKELPDETFFCEPGGTSVGDLIREMREEVNRLRLLDGDAEETRGPDQTGASGRESHQALDDGGDEIQHRLTEEETN
ncbi:guanine nucleotide exchange factor DBS-like isoform X4 [Branchiostoma lanceolatum]|uniref:guanine nucleotide exchange factor DBS-like isoform X4 n=1 Tax=Branchiostoma lanceolatum TaxID=7740 RepID=UPI003456879B